MPNCAVCEHPVAPGELCELCGFACEPEMLPIEAIEEITSPAVESPFAPSTCPRCEATQVEASPIACVACGYRLALRRSDDGSADAKRCKECGTRADASAVRCRNCGTRL